jgi:ATP-dependent DNA helicase RecQ
VTPVAAAVRDPPAAFTAAAAEVDEHFELPLARLLDPALRRASLWDPARLPERLAAVLERSVPEMELPGMAAPRYEMDADQLCRTLGCDADQLRALIGHLTRAGVLQPAPSSPERVSGRLIGEFDGRAAATVRTSMGDASKARWRQYRDIWAFVEDDDCRRRKMLRHFGDPADPRPTVPCCDVCAPAIAPVPPPPDPVAIADLDDAIISVARLANPAVGRTTCAEILHGARTKKIERNSYDGLPGYGTSAHLRRADIVERIDELIEAKRLATSGGAYPVLKAPRVTA